MQQKSSTSYVVHENSNTIFKAQVLMRSISTSFDWELLMHIIEKMSISRGTIYTQIDEAFCKCFDLKLTIVILP